MCFLDISIACIVRKVFRSVFNNWTCFTVHPALASKDAKKKIIDDREGAVGISKVH